MTWLRRGLWPAPSQRGHARVQRPILFEYAPKTPIETPNWTVAQRVRHCRSWLRHWMREAERLEREWDRRKAEEVTLAKALGLSDVEATVRWEKSLESQGLQSVGVWAHRKAKSYALAILAEEAAARALHE